MQKLNLHLALNPTSIGQTSSLLLRTLYEQELEGKSNLDLTIVPIGNPDLSSQKVDEKFKFWVNQKLVKGLETHNREINSFKLWHLQGSQESVSNKQTLLSFYELDSPTKVELNIAKNNKTCFSSQYTCDIFKIFGIDTHYLPLAFDSYNFHRIEKKYHLDDRIVCNLGGKGEFRKSHNQVIKAWIKAFGNNRRYFLQCAIYNPFFTPEQNNEFIKQALEGKEKPFNVSFYPFMKENAIYNDFLNSGDIIIGMSGGEGFGLPEMQSVAIGKHAVIMDAHGYKGWANKENSILISPSGKKEVYDGVFFHKGQMQNQGNIFTFNDDEFIEGCKSAILRVESNRLNVNGLELQEKFSKEKFVDNIVKLSLE